MWTLTGRMRRLSAMLWLKRCWFPQWEQLERGGVVACGVQGPLVDGGGELLGAGSAGDGHA